MKVNDAKEKVLAATRNQGRKARNRYAPPPVKLRNHVNFSTDDVSLPYGLQDRSITMGRSQWTAA